MAVHVRSDTPVYMKFNILEKLRIDLSNMIYNKTF